MDMNKRKIEHFIPLAYEALIENDNINNIEEGKPVIEKSFKNQIAAFGAAVKTGSLLAAVCYFSDNGGAGVKRNQLINVIWAIMKKEEDIKEKTLYDYIKNQEEKRKEIKNQVLQISVAIKLAMNLFTLKELG